MITNILVKRREGSIRPLWKGVEWNKVILILISLFIYGILLPSLGYLITTFGLMFFLFGRIGRTRLWIQAVIASITSLVTYIIFHVWLEVLLPKGIFGF